METPMILLCGSEIQDFDHFGNSELWPESHVRFDTIECLERKMASANNNQILKARVA
jgi:hypothetical protein